MTNDRRAVQLGMPWGTAQNQLRKQVLFKMVVKAGEAACYRCKKDIQTAEELSIEHIEPWLDVSAELFWDLENITFSHRNCNRPHRNKLKQEFCIRGHKLEYCRPSNGRHRCSVCDVSRRRIARQRINRGDSK